MKHPQFIAGEKKPAMPVFLIALLAALNDYA